MEKMDLEELRSRVGKIQWFHDFELVPGVMTNGWTPMAERLSHFHISQDLAGKRVLDIGCADGYFTFLAESRGADVIAIDSWPREGFFLAHEVLSSRAEFYHMSVYDLCPDTFGLFDIVFFFGVYYHLKSPLLALERIASVTREYAIIESAVVDSQCAGGKGFSRFYEFGGLNADPSNWWGPDITCLVQTTRAAGFPRVELVSCQDDARAFVHAYKGPRTAGKPLTENLFVTVDTPAANARAEGIVPVSGWALHQLEPQDGIKHVTVYLDNLDDPGSMLGEAEYGIHREDLRPSLSPIYGDVGFQFAWDATGTPPGEHTLYVLVEGEKGWNYSPIPINVGVPEAKQSLSDIEALSDSIEQEQGLVQDDVIAEPDRRIAEREAEIAHLRELVAGYERGRYIRLMRWLHETWQSVLNNRYIMSSLDLLRTARFCQQLVREVGRASSHAFVDRAYWRVLRRAPDTVGFTHYVDMLAKGQCSRRDVVVSLVQSTEFRTQPRPIYGITEALHQVRFQLVSQLPAADHVLDLGGAAPSSIQGALLVMGYPHHVRSLTIVDLPPDDRLGDYDCGSSEKPGDWIDTEMGPVRYLHTSMTDLSAIESNSIDLVFAGQSIEHVSEEDGRLVMREVFRLLRPGGHFCLDTPNGLLARILSPDVIVHPEHRFEYRVDELVTRLRDVGFEIVEVKGICPMSRTVQTGVFDEQELFANARLSDDAENSYLFYVKCMKPE